MESDAFDEERFFRTIAESGARSLLIGRRALAALGLPVLTADYDFWVHPDDLSQLNTALAPLGLAPSLPPDQARARGRYVLENGEKIDVLVARVQPTVDGDRIAFDEVWNRRRTDFAVALPCIRDLIATKRFGARAKDAEDIRMLEILLEEEP